MNNRIKATEDNLAALLEQINRHIIELNKKMDIFIEDYNAEKKYALI